MHALPTRHVAVVVAGQRAIVGVRVGRSAVKASLVAMLRGRAGGVGLVTSRWRPRGLSPHRRRSGGSRRNADKKKAHSGSCTQMVESDNHYLGQVDSRSFRSGAT